MTLNAPSPNPAVWPSDDQASRMPPALHPAYAPVDGRSEIDSLAFLLNYAKLVRFYNLSGATQGDWSTILDKDPAVALAGIAWEARWYIGGRFAVLLEEVRKALDDYRLSLIQSLQAIALLQRQGLPVSSSSSSSSFSSSSGSAGSSATAASSSSSSSSANADQDELEDDLARLDPRRLQAMLDRLYRSAPWVGITTGDSIGSPQVMGTGPAASDGGGNPATAFPQFIGLAQALAPPGSGSDDLETAVAAIARNPAVSTLGAAGQRIQEPFLWTAGNPMVPPRPLQTLLERLDTLNLVYYDQFSTFIRWTDQLIPYPQLQANFKRVLNERAPEPAIALRSFTETLYGVIPTQHSVTDCPPAESVPPSWSQSQLLTYIELTKLLIDVPDPDQPLPEQTLQAAPLRLCFSLAGIQPELVRAQGNLVFIRCLLEALATGMFEAQLADTTGLHSPDKGLLLAFTRMLQPVRAQANGLTRKHLSYYFRDLLQLAPRPTVPDAVDLVFTPASPTLPTTLAAGTELRAGKDSAGNAVTFALTRSLEVNGVGVGDIRSLLANAARTGVATSPAATGATATGGTATPTTCSFGRDTSGPAAEYGVAISSPVLRLGGGRRQITLALWPAGKTVPALEALIGLDGLFPPVLRVLLSGSGAWITPDTVKFTFVNKHTLVMGRPGPALVATLTLGTGAAPVVDFDPVAMQAATGLGYRPFPAGLPLLILLRNQDATGGAVPFPRPFDSVELADWRLEVEVGGLTAVTLQNDQGPLSATKPFTPFGAKPLPGSALIVGCAEALQKRLDTLTLQWNWPTPPPALADYYAAYEATVLSGITDLDGLAKTLQEATTGPVVAIRNGLQPATLRLLFGYPGMVSATTLGTALLQDFNTLINGPSLFEPQYLTSYSDTTRQLNVLYLSTVTGLPSAELLARVNRSILSDLFPDPLPRVPAFTIGFDILSGGGWDTFALFPLLTLPTLFLHWPETLPAPVPLLLQGSGSASATPAASLPTTFDPAPLTLTPYTGGTQQGFLRVRLAGPAFGFGQDLYPQLVSAAQTELVQAQQALVAATTAQAKAAAGLASVTPSSSSSASSSSAAADWVTDGEELLASPGAEAIGNDVATAVTAIDPPVGMALQIGAKLIGAAQTVAGWFGAAKPAPKPPTRPARSSSTAAARQKSSVSPNPGGGGTTPPPLPPCYQQRVTEAQELQQSLQAPLVPNWSGVAVSYRSHLTSADADAATVYHLVPFGFARADSLAVVILAPPPLLPPAVSGSAVPDATLFLGLARAAPQQVVTFYFQFVTGTANPSADPPTPQWLYLSAGGWQTLSTSDLLADGTDGFVRSGVIRLRIPADASATSTIMPAGSVWLAVVIDPDSTAIDTLATISTQAGTAVWKPLPGQGPDRTFPLPAGTITELAVPNPKLKPVQQPDASYGGEPAETETGFDLRTSERLRHRNRAVTVWDYARIVMAAFPEVSRVMVLKGYAPGPAPAALFSASPGPWTANCQVVAQPGSVVLVVVPREALQVPGWGPALVPTSNLRSRIAGYLRGQDGRGHLSDSVQLSICGPYFEEVIVRAEIVLRRGTDAVAVRSQVLTVIASTINRWQQQPPIPAFESSCSAGQIVSALMALPAVSYVTTIRLGRNPPFADQPATTAFTLFAASTDTGGIHLLPDE